MSNFIFVRLCVNYTEIGYDFCTRQDIGSEIYNNQLDYNLKFTIMRDLCE